MPKDDDDDFTIDIEEIEIEIDVDVVNDIITEFEQVVHQVSNKYLTQDIRFELINALLAMSAQYAIDIDFHEEAYLELATSVYKDEEELTQEEINDMDKSKLS